MYLPPANGYLEYVAYLHTIVGVGMKKILCYTSVWAMMVVALYAGGFQLNECGTKAVGMGSAFSAGLARDASILYYNPAGMTGLADGLHTTVGLSYISPGGSFTGPTNYNTTQQRTNLKAWSFPIPNAYLVYNMKSLHLAAGVGVFVPFGLGTEYPEDWSGRNLAVRTYLETITINPNIAWSFLDDKLSIAAGMSYSMGKVELRQRLTNFSPEPVVNLDGTGNSMSFNAALTAELMQGLRIGVSYRHNIQIDYSGNAVYTIDSALKSRFVDGGGSTSLNLPMDIRGGINYEVMNGLNVELDFIYTGWSSFDTLSLHFDKAPADPSRDTTIKNPRLYKNDLGLRLGADYRISDKVNLRAGVIWDPAPVEAQNVQPFLPDVDRIGFSLGLTHRFSDKFSLDLAYFGITGAQREVKESPVHFDGIYKAYANILAVGLNYSF